MSVPHSATHIRQAQLPQDEPAILSFINGLQEHEAAFERNRRCDKEFAAEYWRDLQQRCAEKHGAVLIAEENGNVIGWAAAHDELADVFVTEAERHHGQLAELYVLPEWRGKGHGRALIQACEDWTRSRGHKLMMIGVLAHNDGSIRSYEKAGYRPYALFMRRYL